MRIGIDLGGTKTEVIALSEAGEQLFRHRLPTPRNDYQQTIETIATLVAMAEKATGQTGTVGIGIPGSISPYTGVVKNANSTRLNGQPFDKISARVCNVTYVWRMTRTVWPFQRRSMAPPPEHRRFCGDHRYWLRRGRRAQWSGTHRWQRYGGRMGTQPFTVDGRG